MGFEYKIGKKQNIVFIRFMDILDDKSLLASFNKIYADPEYTPVMNQCVNYSDVSDLLITRLGVEELVTLCENFDCLNIKWKTYIIAPDDLVFGYGRMYQILCDGSNEEINVVRSLDAALKLMAISPDTYPFPKEEIGGIS